jgi:hypothetical protein
MLVGYINIKVSNYQTSDMEKYYTNHLEKHFNSSNFGREKNKKCDVDPYIV